VFEIEYDTKNNKRFADLTVRRWVEYARRIGQSGSKTSDAENIEDDYDGDQSGMNDEQVEIDVDEQFTEDDDEQDEDDSELSRLGKKKPKKPKKEKHASKAWITFV